MTVAAPAHAQRLEALWYATGGQSSLPSFFANAKQITIISPQVFGMDSTGAIRGAVDQAMIDTAHKYGVKLVPLVMNPGFDQPTIHRVITDSTARRTAISNLVSLCRDNHFDGIQFDIENVHISDRDALTSFMRDAAIELHKIPCSVSAAVVPRMSDDPGPTSYHKWIFDNWRGVYDYKALADALDFISYMTYAQHTGGSTPGPVAGYTWTKDCLDFVLSLGVPPSKISLGVASYSDWWFPVYDDKTGSRMRGSDISYPRAMAILDSAKTQPTWDGAEHAWTAAWSRAGVYEQMWIEDVRAFRDKVDLARKYKLRGYSVWVLGAEDPRVWQ